MGILSERRLLNDHRNRAVLDFLHATWMGWTLLGGNYHYEHEGITMSLMHHEFNHGDSVLVFDSKGAYDFRGVVIGRHDTRDGRQYSVRPENELSLSKSLHNLPEHRLRATSGAVGRMVKMYDGQGLPNVPKHIRDSA
jgi:hypothetical protein